MKYCVLLAVACFVGCDQSPARTSTQRLEQIATEKQQAKHLTHTPPPALEHSQERVNLIKRLERFNVDDKVSYIYLTSYGKVMAFYVVKGKVSSVNSWLTTPEQIKTFERSEGGDHSVVVASPDLDGSYGSNGDAIFFYTTDDTYVEWSGNYMLCDKPLKLSTPPQMVISVEE